MSEMGRSVSQKDIKILYGKSAGRCNICSEAVILEGSSFKEFNIGEMAHNYSYADNPSAPRHEQGRSWDNSYSNLILLCPTHHAIVDGDPDAYPNCRLQEIKNNFESNITNVLEESLFKKNTSDRARDGELIFLINESVNLQGIMAALNDPLYQLPYDLADITDMEYYLLSKVTPTLYPFRDDGLNSRLQSVLTACHYLNSFILKHYFFDAPGCLNGEMRPNKTEEFLKDSELIQKANKNLVESIYNWLLYCRSNNFM